MTEADFNLIEAAIQDQLSPAEIEAVHQRMESDSQFKTNYLEVQLMINATKSVALERVVKEVADSSESSKINRPLYSTLAIAATLAIIAVAGIWLYRTSSAGLFEEYYSPYESLRFSKSRGSLSTYDLKTVALRKYQNHENTAAIEMLNALLLLDSADRDVLFLMGLSYLDDREFDKAIEILDKIKNPKNDATLWYSALAYLGAGNKHEARELLMRISVKESQNFSDRAGELLEKL